jgi:hypothetical protein
VVADSPGAGAASGAHAASAYLRELLFRPGRYRRKWEQYAERSRPGQVNQLAVAEVLAHYLWEHPRTAGDTEVLPRQLKDTAGRVLSGKLLSKPALALFMDAFDLSPFEREQLAKLLDGSARVRVLTGSAGVDAEQAAVLGKPAYRTLTLHDHHYIGPDGLPARHRTLQTIEALADGVDRIPYRADTSALAVEVGMGCRGLDGTVRRITRDLFAVDMLLATPLSAGQTTTIEHTTSFLYTAPPPREFRRIIVFSLENVDIRVQFDPGRLPHLVEWAVWDGLDGPVTEREQVALDAQLAAHRYVRLAERTAIGFRWEWA